MIIGWHVSLLNISCVSLKVTSLLFWAYTVDINCFFCVLWNTLFGLTKNIIGYQLHTFIFFDGLGFFILWSCYNFKFQWRFRRLFVSNIRVESLCRFPSWRFVSDSLHVIRYKIKWFITINSFLYSLDPCHPRLLIQYFTSLFQMV